jgi:anti-sigma factor RsiW
MRVQDTTVVEVRLLHEEDLKAFAGGRLDPLTAEAIEAYLLHHPQAAGRVDAYRRELEGSRRKQPRLD